MSVQSINISSSNIKGNCQAKCAFGFKYQESSSTAKNNGVLINLTYDNQNNAPVVYNSAKYTVDNIVITSPSIHIFNNNTAPGEIIVTHTPQKGGNPLKVCISFKSSSETSKATNIITDIIEKVSTNAPSQGDSTNLNMSYNLQDIIPKKPFFVYNDLQNDWIVYDEMESIPLSSTTIETLQKIIKPFSIPTPGENLYYNSNGPVGISIGDGIYISCQPTGSSEEETEVEYEKNSTTAIDVSGLVKSDGFKIFILILIGCIAFVLLFFGLNSLYKYISSKDGSNSINVNKFNPFQKK